MSDQPGNHIPLPEESARPNPMAHDPKKPLPGELPPGFKEKYIRIASYVLVFGLGLILGLAFSPATPEETEAEMQALRNSLIDARQSIASLNRSLAYGSGDKDVVHLLSAKDRQRHEREGKRYAKMLKNAGAQSAAELVEWFIGRWNHILDQPQADDRTTRRAEALSQLVGGMAKNLDPDDYAQWQAEFFSEAHWLGELHFDMDGDGLPGPRSAKNKKDGFVDTSVCQIAMAMNLAVSDAQILVTPQMRCDSPKAKMSVFLQGRTFDDALTELVKAMQIEGFVVRETTKRVGQRGKKSKAGTFRLILVMPKA